MKLLRAADCEWLILTFFFISVHVSMELKIVTPAVDPILIDEDANFNFGASYFLKAFRFAFVLLYF